MKIRCLFKTSAIQDLRYLFKKYVLKCKCRMELRIGAFWIIQLEISLSLVKKEREAGLTDECTTKCLHWCILQRLCNQTLKETLSIRQCFITQAICTEIYRGAFLSEGQPITSHQQQDHFLPNCGSGGGTLIS